MRKYSGNFLNIPSFPESPPHIPLPDLLAFIVLLPAAAEAEEYLDVPAGAHLERENRDAFFVSGGLQFPDVGLREEEGTIPSRIIAFESGSERVRGYACVLEYGFPTEKGHVGSYKIYVSETAGFALLPREDTPRLDGFEDVVVVARAAVPGDNFHGKRQPNRM